MLLHLPRAEQQALLAHSRRELQSNPAHRNRAYDEMWRRSMRAGVALNLGDIVPGGASMSAAIVDRQGAPVAALGVAGLRREFTDARIAATRALLETEAARIGREQADLIAELVAS